MIFDTAKIKKGVATSFSTEGEITSDPVAFRVSDSANEIAIIVTCPDPNTSLTILGSNHVFGGGDVNFQLPVDVSMLILENASLYVQTDGEYKGCVIVHCNGAPCKVDVKEIY